MGRAPPSFFAQHRRAASLSPDSRVAGARWEPRWSVGLVRSSCGAGILRRYPGQDTARWRVANARGGRAAVVRPGPPSVKIAARRCAAGLRPDLDPGAPAGPGGQKSGQAVACPPGAARPPRASGGSLRRRDSSLHGGERVEADALRANSSISTETASRANSSKPCHANQPRRRTEVRVPARRPRKSAGQRALRHERASGAPLEAGPLRSPWTAILLLSVNSGWPGPAA